MSRFRRLAVLGLLTVIVSACGGGGGGTTTTPTGPGPTPGPSSSDPVVIAPYTFNFGTVTSTADRQAILDGVQYAHAFFLSTFGRTITEATTVTASTSAQGCANGGGAAFTGPREVTFCVGNPGWLAHGPIVRQKIAMHEIYHVLQFEMGWLGKPLTGAEWILEGAAEIVAFRAIAAKGLLPFETALGCMVKEVADFAVQQPPGLPNLQQLEGPQQFRTTQGPLYALAFIGLNQLTTSGGLPALNTYGTAIAGGTDFPSAFTSAFGTPRSAFYAQWPAHLASLPVPATYLCGV